MQRSVPGTLVSREAFWHLLEEAHRAGFELASFVDALDVLAGRRRARRDLSVVTVDDVYRDVYDNAFPVLKALGVPATLYVASGCVGTERHFAHDRLFHLARTALERRFRPLYDGLPPQTSLLLEPVLMGPDPRRRWTPSSRASRPTRSRSSSPGWRTSWTCLRTSCTRAAR
ncbi:MAG: polysaccharide deacetylase family protein [Deltaproteobacteria bacterium]|nr:polysaccharide deacetylase family protein [Deltaproteobacteria bacterium]